ncbi:hypothetical protein BX616_005477, partial [Lobosporangium transversale]
MVPLNILKKVCGNDPAISLHLKQQRATEQQIQDTACRLQPLNITNETDSIFIRRDMEHALEQGQHTQCAHHAQPLVISDHFRDSQGNRHSNYNNGYRHNPNYNRDSNSIEAYARLVKEVGRRARSMSGYTSQMSFSCSRSLTSASSALSMFSAKAWSSSFSLFSPMPLSVPPFSPGTVTGLTGSSPILTARGGFSRCMRSESLTSGNANDFSQMYRKNSNGTNLDIDVGGKYGQQTGLSTELSRIQIKTDGRTLVGHISSGAKHGFQNAVDTVTRTGGEIEHGSEAGARGRIRVRACVEVGFRSGGGFYHESENATTDVAVAKDTTSASTPVPGSCVFLLDSDEDGTEEKGREGATAGGTIIDYQKPGQLRQTQNQEEEKAKDHHDKVDKFGVVLPPTPAKVRKCQSTHI